MSKALTAILSSSWAILPDQLSVIASIAEREHEFAGDLKALEARLGRPLGNTMRATVRDGIAIIPVEGPVFRRANLVTEMSGATAFSTLATDFAEALSNPSITGILLQIDSPGGEVNGTSEFAQMVEAATKPVWAYVGGLGASAAYWIASAADKIIAADTAQLGSIGVMAGYSIKDAKAGEKSFRFVSSQSPNKNASPDTDAGAQQIQANVDALAQVFIDAVSRNRNTTAENVVNYMGAGAVFVAAEALERGMVDAIGTFEGTLQQMKTESHMDFSKLTVASLTEARADLVAEIQASAVAGVEKVDIEAIKAEAATAERDRIVQLEALSMPGTEDLICKFKADGTQPAQAAIEILKAAKAGGAKQPGAAAHLTGLKQTEDGLNAPKAGSGSDVEPSLEDAAKAATALARKAGIDA